VAGRCVVACLMSNGGVNLGLVCFQMGFRGVVGGGEVFPCRGFRSGEVWMLRIVWRARGDEIDCMARDKSEPGH
jgi:hypothetical protein